MIVIHHNKDLDGFVSGAICKLKYPNAKLIGWDYAEPIPWGMIPSSEDVIMIDVSFKIDDLIRLRKLSKSLTIIDHHVSFKKEYDEHLGEDNFDKHGIKLIYKLGIAACEIGWEYLFPDETTPAVITHLGRYDTWRKDEGDWDNVTLPFQYYMRLICTSASTFNTMLLKNSGWIRGAIEQGKAILKYQEEQDRLACLRSAFEATLSGKRAICLNSRSFSSNTMKSVYNPELHDLMVGFEYTGKKWTVSLRSDKSNVDVSVIAKSRGGGGHKAAAGFECDSFEEIFK